MSKIVKALIGLVAVLAVIVGAVLLLFDVNQFRGPIQAELEKALNRKVTLGQMGLKLFPLSIRIADAQIAEDPALQAKAPFLQAKEIAVRADLMALLRKEVKVQSVAVTQPVIELIKTPAGKWNFSTLGSSAPASPQGGASGELTLDEVRIDDGRIALTDLEARKPRAEYQNIDVTLRDWAPGRSFTLSATVHLPEKLALDVSAKAKRSDTAVQLESAAVKLGGLTLQGAGSVGLGSPAALNLQVSSRDASIVELARVAAAFGVAFTPDMKVTGTLNTQLKVEGTSDKPEITGTVAATKFEVSRAAWKLPVRVPEVRVDITKEALKTNRFAAECGNTKLDAALSVSNYNTPAAFLAGVFSTTGASLGELLNIAAAYGVTAAAGMSGDGVVNLNAKLSGRLKDSSAFSYSGSGALTNATLTLPTLTKPVKVENVNLHFEQDKAVLDNVRLAVGSTNLKGSVKARRFSAPELDFDVTIDQIISAELSKLSKSDGGAAPAQKSAKPAPGPLANVTGGGTVRIGKIAHDGMTLTNVRSECKLDRGVIRLEPLTAELFGGRQSGRIIVDTRTEATSVALSSKIEQVEANDLLSAASSIKQVLFGLIAADADLSFVSRPGEDIAKTLTGTFQLRMNEGKLNGVNMLNEMASLAKSFGVGKKTELVTNILKLNAALKIDNGVASTNDLRLDFAGGSLAANGVIGLVDQALKLKVTSVLSKESSDQLGGNKVSGILNTVLANSKGELVIPALITGTAAKPRFVPDAEQFAKMRAQAMLPTASNPAALTSTVLGAIEEGRKGSVKGVLETITGRKKTEEPKTDAPPAGEPAKTAETEKKATPQEAGRKIGESLFDLLKKRGQK